MKTHLIPILIVTVCCLAASAQTNQYVTLTMAPVNGTNSYTIVQGQAAEIVNISNSAGSIPTILMQKDGFTFLQLTVNQIIQGPASFQFGNPFGNPAWVTLEIFPESYNPNKTLIVPPGTNQVQITLQVSPDLVNWTTATNGVYGSPNSAQFFRISEQVLGPQ